MGSATTGSSGVLVLHKTIDILEALRLAPGGLPLGQLTARLKMPKATVFRILATLESRGYLDRSTAGDYRIARKLGARPLARQAARELESMGEPVEKRLGRRAAALIENSGLTRRELEVMRLVSVGRSNPEIANELFLSPRTIDMHLRNILMKLGCRSRTEATRRAAELGLIDLGQPAENARPTS